MEAKFVHAPFSAEQVEALNGYQHSRVMHPFTCANRTDLPHADNPIDRGLLVATEAGWVCSECPYTQDWAWAWMADRSRWEALDWRWYLRPKTQ